MIDFYDMTHIERQKKWDRRWLRMAQEVSRDSKDPSTKVGAVIVNDRNQVVATGYNGFPRGVWDSEERLFNRELKLKLVCHAEENAIWVAGDRAEGSTIYVWPSCATPPTCHECAKAVIQSGIRRVVGLSPSIEDFKDAEAWRESTDLAGMMLTEAGVKITEVTP